MIAVRRLAAAAALALLLVACSDPVSRDNYARIESDMEETRVLDILGPPDRSRSATVAGLSGAQHAWDGDDFVIAVQFVNDRVVSKQLLPSG